MRIYSCSSIAIYSISAALITNNLDIYSQFLRTRASRFTIKALLHLNEVILEPDAASIMNGTIRVIRNMLDGTKKFVRFYRYVSEKYTILGTSNISNIIFTITDENIHLQL